ncbi:MAG: shikimate kinase [bacterium]
MGRSRKNGNIILIGMPGSGKSTLGVLLAKALTRPFLDTDIHIQTREGKPLQRILNEHGIAFFLRLEQECILSLSLSRHVIATGGSVVYGARAMAHLKRQGLVVLLELSLPFLRRRLRDMHNRGIVLAPGQDLAALYAERKPLYERYADLRVSCDRKTHEQVIGEILAALDDRGIR